MISLHNLKKTLPSYYINLIHFHILTSITASFPLPPDTIAISQEPQTQIVYPAAVETRATMRMRHTFILRCEFYSEMTKTGPFVDKSLLLEKIFNPLAPNYILVTAPHNWGKSINLDMISFFANMAVHPNGSMLNLKKIPSYHIFSNGKYPTSVYKKNNTYEKYSNKLLISKKGNIINQHLGQYSVLKLDLHFSISDISENNTEASFQKFFKTMTKNLRFLCTSHRYIKYKLESMAVQDPSIGTILEKFESISTNNDVSESMALRSMQILYRCIRLCFPDGKILVLIDNYDSIFEKIYLSPGFNYDSEDARKIKLFIRDFLKKTCQKPASFPGYRMVKQLKVIITGVTHVPGSDFFPDLDDSTEWSMTNSGIYPYYGFTSDEVEQLANLRSVDYYYMKSLLQNTYDGYRDISCPDQPLFNPVSVIEFLNHRGPVSFWSKDEGNTLREILFQLSKNLEMVYLFGLLLIGKPIKISASANQGIPIDKIDNIAAAIRGEFVRVLDDRSIHQIFSFLLSYEYLTLATKQPPNASFFNAKLSRKEIKDVSMKAFLQNHLTARLLHHHQYLINDTILAFGNYIEDSSDKSNEQLKVTISRLFDKTGPLKNFKTAIERYKNEKPKGEFVNVVFNDVEESAARGILAHVLVKLQYNGILNVSMDEEQVVERESNEFNFKICMLGYDEEGRVIIIKHEHVEEDSVEEYDLQQAVKDNAHLIQKIISSPLKYCKIVTLNTFNSNDLKMNFQVINAI